VVFEHPGMAEAMVNLFRQYWQQASEPGIGPAAARPLAEAITSMAQHADGHR
jgi:hypothetical protein